MRSKVSYQPGRNILRIVRFFGGEVWGVEATLLLKDFFRFEICLSLTPSTLYVTLALVAFNAVNFYYKSNIQKEVLYE